MIFQTLGSNFTFLGSMKRLFAVGTTADTHKLEELLAKRYQGSATLFYRGRGALSAAVAATVRPGSKVVVNGFTCYAVVQAVREHDAKVVYADIDPGYLHFTLTELEQAAEGQKIQAVVVQNTLGYAIDIQPIEEYCKQHEIILIEDLAHSIGARYPDGREVGTVGDMTVLSFGRDKVIDAVNGGALIVRNPSLQAVLEPTKQISHLQHLRDRMYPLLAWKIRIFYPVGLGKLLQVIYYKLGAMVRSADGGTCVEYKLPRSTCRYILHEFDRLENNLKSRNLKASLYIERLKEIFTIPSIATANATTPALRVPLLTEQRQELLELCRSNGFSLADIWYDTPISPERFMKQSYVLGTCPKAEAVSSHIMNLPTHKSIGKRDIDRLCNLLTRASHE